MKSCLWIAGLGLAANTLFAQPDAKIEKATEALKQLSNRYLQYRGTGIGVILGEPTGIAVKKWLNFKAAFAMAASWSFADDGGFHLHIDYIVHRTDLIKTVKGGTLMYYGIGERFKLGTPNRFGIRIPLGINHALEKKPFDLFFEVVPILDLSPAAGSEISIAGGFRYYRKR